MINEQASDRFHIIDWDAVQRRNELALGSSGGVRSTRVVFRPG